MANEKRLFSEQEVTQLVRRAVELQEAGQSDYTPGVTPEELERVATELGVDAKYLHQAMAEALQPPGKKGPLNLTEEFERVVDVDLPAEDFDVLLEHLKRVSNRRGFTQVGRSLTGMAWTGASFANVDVTSRQGRTKVKVKSHPLFAYLVTYHPAIIASFVAAGAMGGNGNVWGGLALAAGVMGVATLGFRALVKRGHDAARRLADKLAASVAETKTSDLNIQPTAAKLDTEAEVEQRA